MTSADSNRFDASIALALVAAEESLQELRITLADEERADGHTIAAVVSRKLAAVQRLGSAFRSLDGVFKSNGFSGGYGSYAVQGGDANLKERVQRLLDDVRAAEFANAVNREIVASKLALTKTIGGFLRDLQLDNDSSDSAAARSSVFASASPVGNSRSWVQA